MNINKRYFTVGNVLLLQTVGIFKEFGLSPFWADLCSYNHKLNL